MKRQELIDKIKAKSTGKVDNVLIIGNPFFAARLNAPSTWAVRAIEIKEQEMIVGHVTWNLKGQIKSAEELTKYDSLRKFETMSIIGIDEGLDTIIRFLGIDN